MKLDRFDKAILDILQTDGHISNQELADRIGLSPPPCLRRVKALEQAGLILGYQALVDAKKTRPQPDGLDRNFHGSAHTGTLRQF